MAVLEGTFNVSLLTNEREKEEHHSQLTWDFAIKKDHTEHSSLDIVGSVAPCQETGFQQHWLSHTLHAAKQVRQAVDHSHCQQLIFHEDFSIGYGEAFKILQTSSSTTYESTESAFPSCHPSQSENIPQDGQAYCCHPQGVEGTG